MRRSVLSTTCCVALCISGIFCVGGQKGNSNAFFFGADTVSTVTALNLSPDSADSQTQIRRIAIAFSLARAENLKNPFTADSSFAADLANQLSLRTGTQWNTRQAQCLYGAAKIIKKQGLLRGSGKAVAVYIDSLLASSIRFPSPDSAYSLKASIRDSVLGAITETQSADGLSRSIAALLYVNSVTATIVTDFLFTEGTTSKGADASSFVKGLVASDKVPQATSGNTAPVKAAVSVADDPTRALRYRSQQSIADSIKKHLPTLEAIYKKELKVNENMRGTVWVAFVIAPDGSVSQARIKSSQIPQRSFLDPFAAYVATIRFLSVPPSVGPMSFEFPFEFTPEN